MTVRSTLCFYPSPWMRQFSKPCCKNPWLRRLSFTEAEAVTRIFPFLARLVLPRAVIDFERIIPSTDLILIATPNVVLVRNDVHPALIDLLAQAIVEAHGRPGIFQQAG